MLTPVGKDAVRHHYAVVSSDSFDYFHAQMPMYPCCISVKIGAECSFKRRAWNGVIAVTKHGQQSSSIFRQFKPPFLQLSSLDAFSLFSSYETETG